jgi:hypothetical protein
MRPTGSEYNGIIVGTVWTARLAARAGDDVREQLRLSVPLQTEGTGWDVGWAAVYLHLQCAVEHDTIAQRQHQL